MSSTRQNPETGTATREASRPLLLGHRGTTISAPENTFEAFDRALADGCDGIEFDVRVTCDSHAIICHDPSYAHREIASSSLSSLQRLGARFPSLSDVIRTYGPRCFLYIELKVCGAESELISVIGERPPAHGYVVASFHPEVLLGVHDLAPDITLGLICGTKRQLHKCSDLPIDYILLKHSLATAAHVSTLRAAGKRVFVWTVNKEKHMRALAQLGVDGILSDDTSLLARTLSGKKQSS